MSMNREIVMYLAAYGVMGAFFATAMMMMPTLIEMIG